MRQTIILHDYFASLEGGGRLSSILTQNLPADLAYGFAHKKHPFLQFLHSKQYNLQAHSFIPLWQQFKLAQTFANQAYFLNDYQVAIYSGFYTPLAVKHYAAKRNILYCHTPPRFIYDQKEFYLNRLPIYSRPLLKAFIQYLQPRYENAINKMDLIVANSKNVQARIRHYLNKDSIVIYPPCDTSRFIWQGQSDYYLSVGRLDPLKRVDLIIKAFLKMPHKHLIITSGGSELKSLQKLANNASNIQFTNWLNDSQLFKLIGQAIATIYLPKDEDFGMSPVESMAAGKPVIGVAEGGLLETIIPKQTGILLKALFNIEDICQAVEIMTPNRAVEMRKSCEKQAQKFQTKLFLDNIRNVIK
ncbi:MAG: glycosyltransferase [Thiomargarita sp.]|nr:glycosyltransferase [Thiomargarita sp.]